MKEAVCGLSTWLVTATLVLVLTSGVPSLIAQAHESGAEGKPTIEEKTAAMRKMDGFFPLYWDDTEGKLWMEIAQFDIELLYFRGLSAGLGSNDIGLDRGQPGRSQVVAFERVGPKILMVQPNYQYRATGESLDERRAVEEGFAKSVLFGFTVAAETEGRVLVDPTDFLIRDSHDVIGRLRDRDDANYRLDATRSAVYLPDTRVFPENTEMDVTLTYTSDQPSRLVGTVAPSPGAVTLRQHHSFLQLPDGNYEPRPFDPRAGVSATSYMDYSAPLGEPITKRLPDVTVCKSKIQQQP